MSSTRWIAAVAALLSIGVLVAGDALGWGLSGPTLGLLWGVAGAATGTLGLSVAARRRRHPPSEGPDRTPGGGPEVDP